MKFYNPFKPHIMRNHDGSSFFIRKLTYYGWMYFDDYLGSFRLNRLRSFHSVEHAVLVLKNHYKTEELKKLKNKFTYVKQI